MKKEKEQKEDERIFTGWDRQSKRVKDFLGTHERMVNIVVVAMLFLSCLTVRINSLAHKEELHSDEVFSLMLSTCNPYYNHAIADGTYSGQEVKDRIVPVEEGDVGETMRDLGQLWLNNGDAPHASLYYMALRLALTGYGSYDVKEFVVRGGALNLLLFCLSFLLMYRLLRQIFGRRHLLVYVGLTITFCNLLSVRNTMLLREYQMAETVVVMFTSIAVSVVLKLRSGEALCVRRYLPAFAVSIGCLLSLGYFHVFYIVALGVGVAASGLRYRQSRTIVLVLVSGLLGVGFAWLLYAGFFNFIIHPTVHQTMAFRNFPLAISTVFLRDLPHFLFVRYGYWVLAAVFVCTLFSKGFRRSAVRNPYFLWLPVIVLVCMPLMIYASVLKHPRYFYSLLPILSLLVPQAISMMSDLWRRYFALLIILFFPVLTVQIRLKENYGWAKLTAELNQPSTFYKLNPNEFAQLVPSLSDTISYRILNNKELKESMSDGEQLKVVSKLNQWSADEFVYVGRRIWNKNIYLFDIKNVAP